MFHASSDPLHRDAPSPSGTLLYDRGSLMLFQGQAFATPPTPHQRIVWPSSSLRSRVSTFPRHPEENRAQVFHWASRRALEVPSCARSKTSLTRDVSS